MEGKLVREIIVVDDLFPIVKRKRMLKKLFSVFEKNKFIGRENNENV
jgi:hypothetical protein